MATINTKLTRTDAEAMSASALGDSMVGLQDITRHLGVHVGSVKRWRAQGLLPPPDFALGGIERCRRKTIETWICERGLNPKTAGQRQTY